MKACCLLLAAGDSTRMGGPNKLLLPVDGSPLIKRTLDEIERFAPHEVVVVLGHEPERVRQAIGKSAVRTVVNDRHALGMHSSIRAGLEAMSEDCEAFFVCFGDQPYFSKEVLAALAEAYVRMPSQKIFIPVYEGRRGHPVLISRRFVGEILAEPDGDHGCAYLLERHPVLVAKVPVATPGVLIDVDEPRDYAAHCTRLEGAKDPIKEFYDKASALKAAGEPFAVATVIEVVGSASARTGSKALFDADGRNRLGWVGGGCAERFIGEEARQAMVDGRPRIVTADLDDEVFGLGIACGGHMRLFIEPVLPGEVMVVADAITDDLKRLQADLTQRYGWAARIDRARGDVGTRKDLLLDLARAAAEKRGRSARSLREVKPIPARFHSDRAVRLERVVIVGRSRITEALARHFSLVASEVVVMASSLDAADYPASVVLHDLPRGYGDASFREGDVVIVASHTARDPELADRAIRSDAAYVAMLGSIKRASEALQYLGLNDGDVHAPLYVPAGLDLDARNPEEIALSIVAEVLAVGRG